MKAAVALLRILAAVLVLSCLIGFLVTVYGMTTVFQSIGGGGTVNTAIVANNLPYTLWATSAGFLCFPLGVILHWIIAKKTGVFPSWSRQSLFFGGVFM
jgi:biopolymer transport protein ExbB/TolQ